MTTRRERLRQATIEEIKAIAWQMLKEGQPVTILGITREMGMTAPAFYTYFSSRDDLMAHLVHDALESFFQALSAPYEEESPLERLGVLFIRYRRWALDHANAFGLFAGTPVFGFHSQDPPEKSKEIYRFILSLFQEAGSQAGIKADMASFSPEYLRELTSIREKVDPDMDLPVLHAAIRLISQVHGLISMELSGRFSDMVTDGEAVFRAQIHTGLKEMGLGPN